MTTNFILAPDEVFIQCPYNTAHHVTNARLIRHLTKCRDAFLKELSEEEKSKVMRICRHNALHHVPYPEIKLHEDTCRSANSVVTFLSYHNSEEGRKQYEDRKRFEAEESRKRHRSPSPPHSHSRHKKESKRHRRDRDRSRDRERDRDGHRDRDRERGGDRDGNRDWESNRDNARERDRNSDRNRDQGANNSSNGNAAPPPPTNSDNAWGIEEDNWEDESTGYTAGYDPQLKLKTELIIHNPSGLTKSERKKYREVQRLRAVGGENNDDDDSKSSSNSAENADVKPNITNLQNVTVKSEPEPGEIDDEEEGEVRREVSAGRWESSQSHRPAASSSSSAYRSSSTSHSNYNRNPSSSSNPSTSRSNIGSWYDKGRRDRDDETDSDDFEGMDPYQ